jgi:hypothetical protein
MLDRMKALVGQDKVVFVDHPKLGELMNDLGDLSGEDYELKGQMYAPPNSSLFEYKRVLFDITVIENCKKIVELGVREGHSTDAFTRACYYTAGSVYSFDPGNVDKLERNLMMPDFDDYWTFYRMKGEDGYNRYGKEIGDIDLLYIDTDPHSYPQMKMWMENYWIHSLRPGTILVADDCAPQHQSGVNDTPPNVWNVGAQYGVLQALLEWIDANEDKIEYAFSVSNLESNGTAIIKLR